jgi:hypothetical protein
VLRGCRNWWAREVRTLGKIERRTEGGGILDGATPGVVGRVVRSPRISFGNWICGASSEIFVCDDGCVGRVGGEISKSSHASSFDSADS